MNDREKDRYEKIRIGVKEPLTRGEEDSMIEKGRFNPKKIIIIL